jgi:hypothetical protein
MKLRWTISRGTVAAAFIAAFFLASEGAQILFGAGNEWVGLAAAGALVFAMAPLQRAAERLAKKAVPIEGDPPSTPRSLADTKRAEHEDAYQRALRLALRDRVLAREDERELVLIASRLGIAPERAFVLRDEVEAEQMTIARPRSEEVGE